MSRMGGACSSARQHRRTVHSYDVERRNGRGNRQTKTMNSSKSPHKVHHKFQPARHSVESEVPDYSIASLYPIDDNYVVGPGSTRSPKTLRELCVDAVCRSLPDLDGELPVGMPQDLVDSVFKSLVDHSALNATTLRALKNCEIEQLSLAGCRGVRDEWLTPFSSSSRSSTTHIFQNYSPPPPPLCRASFDQEEDSSEFMECDTHIMEEDWEQNSPNTLCASKIFPPSYSKVQLTPPPLIPKLAVTAVPDEESLFSSSSSSGCTSFISAESSPSSTPNEESVGSLGIDSIVRLTTDFVDDARDYSSLCIFAPNITSNISLLDLRGSPQLTDQGLLQLGSLHSLEIVKLDNCHSVTGTGLAAFSLSNKLHTLSLAHCRRLTDEGVEIIAHLPSLTALSIGGCRCITDRALFAIANMVHLRKLDISQCDLVTDTGIEALYKLEWIEELSIGWCRLISDQGLQALCYQPGRKERLNVLHLARCCITNEGVIHLGNLSSLTELDLNGCSKIRSSVLRSVLEKLPRLKVLDVSYCPDILHSSWQGKINALETLELCFSGVRDQHLARLTHLPSLLELNLDSCPCGDWAVAYLADNNVVPNLTSLDLADTDLTDAGLAHLAKLQLKKLSLFYCNISNDGLRHLSTMASLEVLNLDSRDVSDEGVVFLQKLPHLRSLDIFSGRITDIGCMYLSRIKSLENLELCGGGIGDRGCASLALLENLVTLNLSQNERITNRGAAALAALSKLKCLNLSNTKVNSGALGFLGSLIHLKSLAMYGCQGIDNCNSIDVLRNGLPSLKCLRLNNGAAEKATVYEEEDNEMSDIEDSEEYSGDESE